jgi:hypothetical protein
MLPCMADEEHDLVDVTLAEPGVCHGLLPQHAGADGRWSGRGQGRQRPGRATVELWGEGVSGRGRGSISERQRLEVERRVDGF